MASTPLVTGGSLAAVAVRTSRGKNAQMLQNSSKLKEHKVGKKIGPTASVQFFGAETEMEAQKTTRREKACAGRRPLF